MHRTKNSNPTLIPDFALVIIFKELCCTTTSLFTRLSETASFRQKMDHLIPTQSVNPSYIGAGAILRKKNIYIFFTRKVGHTIADSDTKKVK